VNGVETNIFKPFTADKLDPENKDLFKIICTRRFVEKNGIAFAIKAIKKIHTQIKCKLYLVGVGPLEPELKQLVKTLNIEQSVEFLGGQPNSLIPSLLNSSDLVLIPSLLEATSISGLEAMACEKVIVASRVGGLPEIIDETNGYLFDSGDVNGLSEKILLAYNADRKSLGANARQKVIKSWSQDALTYRHITIYKNALANE
jgi:glycosyltransferase involved in cell wall biosynthesis